MVEIYDIMNTLYTLLYDKVYKTWQNPYHMSYHPQKPISSRGPLGPWDDIGRG